MHSASGRSHSATENLREPQSPGTAARPGSPQETNTRSAVVGTAADSWNSGMTVKAATLSGAQMHGDRTHMSVPDLVDMRELGVCQHLSDQFEPSCPDQDDTSVRVVIGVPVRSIGGNGILVVLQDRRRPTEYRRWTSLVRPVRRSCVRRMTCVSACPRWRWGVWVGRLLSRASRRDHLFS